MTGAASGIETGRRVLLADRCSRERRLGHLAAWLLGRRERLEHLGWRFTLARFLGRDYLVRIEPP
jgi:hypothetical protein